MPFGLKREETDHPGYVVGRWYLPAKIDGAPSAGNAVSANSIRLYPGWIKDNIVINALGLYVSTLQAGGNVQAAIYKNDPVLVRPTGLPLASTASMSSASTGNINSTAQVQLSAGMYWFATNSDNAVNAFTSVNVANLSVASLIGSASQFAVQTASQALAGLSTPQTFGTWPDMTNLTMSDVTGSTVPSLAFKVGAVG